MCWFARVSKYDIKNFATVLTFELLFDRYWMKSSNLTKWVRSLLAKLNCFWKGMIESQEFWNYCENRKHGEKGEIVGLKELVYFGWSE